VTSGQRTNLEFKVRDTGIGISQQNLKSLFSAFTQATEKTSASYGGTGLGLVITRNMAQLLGGDVTAESVLGEGSVFTLTVRSGLHAVPANDDARRGTGPLVLHIEDEANARDLVARALSSLPYTVQQTSEGRRGVTIARTERPALILLDIQLSDMTGWQVLSELRAHPATADIPVVVVSVDGDRKRSFEHGACEHLTKPCSSAQFAATVLRHARAPKSGEPAAMAPMPRPEAAAV
jgi:CheY-like chemotaxis protein